MSSTWEKRLKSWEDARLIDPAAAERIRAFEADRERHGGWRWPVVLAWALGGVLVCAGVLLFVAAHWDNLPASGRFMLVLLMVATFHVAGALLRQRAEALGHVLHAAGTVALGAGIFLSGQIFNLQEHWPGGVMLWAAGAWLAWLMLRDRAQAAFAAILTPVWLAGEWMEATRSAQHRDGLMAEGLLLLALTYFTARTSQRDDGVRRDLVWIGGLALIPLTFWAVAPWGGWWTQAGRQIPTGLLLAGWLVAYGGPLALAFLLRGHTAWMLLVAAAWVRLLGATRLESWARAEVVFSWRTISTYVLCAAGSALMAWWGMVEARRERVNLGVAGFGLTVICFYFSNVMDKLGRSVSLMGLGALFLLGGYLLERTRRRLLAELNRGAP
jgi:uncharacterized membrane protein